MDTPESKVHSFIVKLWLENADDETKRVAWRGYVTHVPDGERRYLKKLSDLVEFIKSYLNGVVRKPGLKERFKSWLRHLKMSL